MEGENGEPGVNPARLDIEAVDGSARAGLVSTARGTFTTPCFMPVGTRGAVRLLDAADLDALGPQLLLANAYHLMLRPGADVVEALGGIHRFMGWDGLILTDSGGYQVFSLAGRVDDDGVTFRSTYDGSAHRLTPEDGGATPGAARARHTDGARRLLRPARAGGSRCGWRPGEPWPGPDRARAAHTKPRPVSVRDRSGRSVAGAAGRSAQPSSSISASTATR